MGHGLISLVLNGSHGFEGFSCFFLFDWVSLNFCDSVAPSTIQILYIYIYSNQLPRCTSMGPRVQQTRLFSDSSIFYPPSPPSSPPPGPRRPDPRRPAAHLFSPPGARPSHRWGAGLPPQRPAGRTEESMSSFHRECRSIGCKRL